MASIVVKTPKRTWTAKQGVVYQDVIQKEIEKNASKIVLNKVAELNERGSNYRSVVNQKISLYATFFQRVVSRTPLDEKYTRIKPSEKTENMLHIKHIPDDSQCRYDWYISDGSSIVSAKAFPKSYFTTVNDKSAVDGIKKKLQTVYAKGLKKSNSEEIIKRIESLEVYNDNPHYKVLEYGGGYNWLNKTKPTKGPGNKYPHGVENNHAVYAPTGMLRISQMELLKESQKEARTNLAARYKGGKKVNRVPSDSELDQFWKLLQKKKFRYADIKRYIGER